jgi:hypothetical protein
LWFWFSIDFGFVGGGVVRVVVGVFFADWRCCAETLFYLCNSHNRCKKERVHSTTSNNNNNNNGQNTQHQ